MVHWLYVTIVQANISFASLVWWPGRQAASTKKRLSKVQRLACFSICMIPTDAMEAINGLPQLDLVIQGEARLEAHCL